MALSPRSLQRALAAQGLDFDGVLDEVRHAAAARLFADPAVSRGEAAWLLGFSDGSGLRRAMKRWSGSDSGVTAARR
jgi:AraC-like DNA-binding protein